MKEIKKMLVVLTIAMVSMMTMAVSCEKPEPEPEPEPEVVKDYNFDLFVCAVKHGGMSQNKNGTYVRSVASLAADQPRVEFTGKGIDITQDYTLESITRGKYYYQVPQRATGGFVKFHITRNSNGEESIIEDAEVPFKDNQYTARKYTHAWIEDGKTLVVMGTANKATKIIWSKLAESNLAIQSEGTLDIKLPEGFNAFSTAGLLTYRPSDQKLYYFYLAKREAGQSDAATSVTYIAIINPSTMAVESNTAVPSEVMEETAGSAYGELMQNMIMHDDQNNLYVAGLITINGQEMGILRRIPAGKKEFDTAWNGFPNPEGKLLTIQYLGDGRALSYSQNASLVEKPKTDSKINFYSVIDLNSGTRMRIKYNGTDLQYCGGRFSQRTVVVNNKAYIGVGGEVEGEAEETYPTIYIYDCKTGTVEKGRELSKGFCFDIIRAMDVE